jgi:hypothetical protein
MGSEGRRGGGSGHKEDKTPEYQRSRSMIVSDDCIYKRVDRLHCERSLHCSDIVYRDIRRRYQNISAVVGLRRSSIAATRGTSTSTMATRTTTTIRTIVLEFVRSELL